VQFENNIVIHREAQTQLLWLAVLRIVVRVGGSSGDGRALLSKTNGQFIGIQNNRT